jgi:hypothetical protein
VASQNADFLQGAYSRPVGAFFFGGLQDSHALGDKPLQINVERLSGFLPMFGHIGHDLRISYQFRSAHCGHVIVGAFVARLLVGVGLVLALQNEVSEALLLL